MPRDRARGYAAGKKTEPPGADNTRRSLDPPPLRTQEDGLMQPIVAPPYDSPRTRREPA